MSTESALAQVQVLHVGHFDPQYSRNRIVAKALRRAGADVRTVTDPRRFPLRAARLTREAARRASRPDVIVVGFPGYADVPLVRAVAPRATPILFDAFVSLYESAVEDRALVRPGTVCARALAFEDRLACSSATRVLLDTTAHVDYFVESLGVQRPRFRRLWVGADDELVQPSPLPGNSRLHVFMYASFIPLHGVDCVVRAAALLQESNDDVVFDIVGAGLTEPDVRRLADDLGVRNVRFHPPRSFAGVLEGMAASDVCLGIFGTSPKTERVIPNKVFDALAAARPVITAETSAASEALVDRDTALLCAPGDAVALADAIRLLQRDDALRAALARRGHELFRTEFSLDAISRDLAPIVAEVLD